MGEVMGEEDVKRLKGSEGTGRVGGEGVLEKGRWKLLL